MRPPGAKWGLPTIGTAGWDGFGGEESTQSTPYRGGQQAGRDWIGAGRAGLGLGLGLGLMDAAQEVQPEREQLPESHRLRARPVGRSAQVGKWAGGSLGRKSLAATGGSSSSGVQLETWARGVGRLGRLLGGPAEGCTSPPFFLPSFQNATAETLSTDEKSLRPSKQKPSRTLAHMANTANKGSAYV